MAKVWGPGGHGPLLFAVAVATRGIIGETVRQAHSLRTFVHAGTESLLSAVRGYTYLIMAQVLWFSVTDEGTENPGPCRTAPETKADKVSHDTAIRAIP